jgi:hypothetical protein
MKKINYWMIGCIVLILLIGYNLIIYPIKRINYLCTYLPRKDAEYLIQYSKYYKLDWIGVMSTIKTESDFNNKTKGKHGETTYFQIMKRMKGWADNVLKDKSGMELVMARGCLIIRHSIDLSKRVKNNLGDLSYVELYNLGLGKVRAKKKNSPYVEKYHLYYTQYKIEWKKYLLRIK